MSDFWSVDKIIKKWKRILKNQLNFIIEYNKDNLEMFAKSWGWVQWGGLLDDKNYFKIRKKKYFYNNTEQWNAIFELNFANI